MKLILPAVSCGWLKINVKDGMRVGTKVSVAEDVLINSEIVIALRQESMWFVVFVLISGFQESCMNRRG